MKIVIAPNSFKDCINSFVVADCIEKGLRKVLKTAEIIKIPLTDGGDGTLDCILSIKSGVIHKIKATGPLGNKINTEYAILSDNTAIIELAKIAGISLIPKNNRNPMLTTTYGVGEAIKDAINKGVKKILLACGGSATCDAGTGILSALGVKFINKQGKKFVPVGSNLLEINKIDYSNCKPLSNITVLCDVNNTLIEAKIYAKQKGATDKDIEILDTGIKHFSYISGKEELSKKQGMGASGGVPFGLSLLGAKITSGAKFIMNLYNFKKKVKDADLIITAEGELDKTTKYGKVVWQVMQVGKKYKIPVIAFAGKIINNIEELYKNGLTSAFSLPLGPISLEESIKDAKMLLENLAERIGRLLNR